MLQLPISSVFAMPLTPEVQRYGTLKAAMRSKYMNESLICVEIKGYSVVYIGITFDFMGLPHIQLPFMKRVSLDVILQLSLLNMLKL